MKHCVFLFALVHIFVAVGLRQLAAQSSTPPPEEINPTGNAGALKPQIQTGGSYDAHSGNATRIVNDLSVPGALGVYGLDFTRYWNSTHNDYQDSEMEWPKDFGMSGWSHSWHWSATYDFRYPDVVLASCGEGGGGVCESDNNQFTTAINITFPDGHTTQYKIVRLEYGDWMSPGSYPQFGPPYTASERTAWANGGAGVHDYLIMAPNGLQFWLTRADGGSVNFIWDATYGFQAREVFDPHGLKTTLSYTIGYLTHVQQEGGRYLAITWEPFSGGEYMITRVQSGSAATGTTQTVNYYYTQPTGYWTLRHVVYENEPLPGGAAGQKVAATYDYGTCYGDGAEPCSGAERSVLPLLKRADDPHYAGAMTVIRYNYRGEHCPPHLVEPWDWPSYVPAQVWAVKSEKDDSGQIVSSFTIECDSGKRREDTGLGGWRMFYYGGSAGTAESTPGGPALCRGYQLGALTDFTRELALPPDLPTERQNFFGSNPYHIWDGRGIRTETIFAAGDYSGEPAEIRHIDGSVDRYNRINPGASEPIDPAQGMHNPYNHWLFSETHQVNATTSHTTTYTRDARRRVKRIDYPDGSYEEFGYNIFNQVTSHRLPSGAVKTYVYDYGASPPTRGLLTLEYNSVDRALDGTNGDIEYTYDALDRVRTKKDGRTRINQKHFSTQMSYNGRHQITRVEYAGIFGAADNPSVWYGYDAYGNCTSISSELASHPGDPYHTKRYEYDSYRRCTAYIEPIWAPNWNGGPTVPSRRWDWIYDRYLDGIGWRPASSHISKSWRIQVEPAFNAAGERAMTNRWHDVNDQVVLEQTGWIQSGSLPLGNWWTGPDTETRYFSYDANGNKETFTDPRGRLTTYQYDLRNRLWKTIEPLNRITETLYDFAGNKTDVTFPDTRSQRWRDYDAFGQAWKFIDERNNTTDLTFKLWGPMKKPEAVTTRRDKDNGATEAQTTTFSFDLIGRATKIHFPDASYEETGYYLGQVHTWRNRKGAVKTSSYDARGRETGYVWNDGVTPSVSKQWDPAHRLTSTSNVWSTVDYGYDSAGQIKWEGNDIAGAGGRRQTTYYRYPNGATAHLWYPSAGVMRFDYTARGQMKIVGWDDAAGNWLNKVIEYHYFPDGTLNYADRGNGVSSGWDWNGRGKLQAVHHARVTPYYQNLSFRGYERDLRDRIIHWSKSSDAGGTPLEDGRGDRYEYDDEGQLRKAWYEAIDPGGSATSPRRFEDFSDYDALGNRRGWTHNAEYGWIAYLRRDNGLNQYSYWHGENGWWGTPWRHDDELGAVHPSYGPPGNGAVMDEGYVRATYNALNQPRSVWSPMLGTAVWFGYDPLGRCVKRFHAPEAHPPGGPAAATHPATYFYYDGWKSIDEGPGYGVSHRRSSFGPGPDEMVSTHNLATGRLFYHHYDARGHCIFLSDWQSGHLLEQYEYDAFGAPYLYNPQGQRLPGDSAYGNRFLFQGKEWLRSLRLYDSRHRLYHYISGRFLQPDPKHFEGGDYNLYRYCHNDPVNHSDPFGLRPDTLPSEAPTISIEAVHVALDVLGTFEPTPFSDLANAALYGLHGDGVNAAISIGGVVPYVGDAGKLAKYGAKLGSAISKTEKAGAQTNRAENIAKGIPANKLGPSGKPKIDVVRHSSRKEAKDAARAEVGKGGTTVKHSSPSTGGPHFHGQEQDGTKVRVHHEYPRK